MSDTDHPINNILGQLTEEEQAVIVSARQRGQQNMLRLGELVFQISRMRQQQSVLELQIVSLREKESAAIAEEHKICEDLESIERDGRIIIDQVTRRLNLEPGIQWVAMQDGTIQRMEK